MCVFEIWKWLADDAHVSLLMFHLLLGQNPLELRSSLKNDNNISTVHATGTRAIVAANHKEERLSRMKRYWVSEANDEAVTVL